MELLTAVTLQSPHGFPTRAGGVSEGPFASLNASLSVGDDARHVRENLLRLARHARVPVERLLTVNQVHGSSVVEGAVGQMCDADALWIKEAHTSVGVRTADCVPLLFEDVEAGLVAATHAGWRGVIGSIATRTVEALVANGAARARLRVAVGPCIQACCFEVDGDLPARFSAAYGAQIVRHLPGKTKVHLDLPAALVIELERAGVARPEVLTACTHCDPRFFSHRRDHGKTGRHLSFITRL